MPNRSARPLSTRVTQSSQSVRRCPIKEASEENRPRPFKLVTCVWSGRSGASGHYAATVTPLGRLAVQCSSRLTSGYLTPWKEEQGEEEEEVFVSQ